MSSQGTCFVPVKMCISACNYVLFLSEKVNTANSIEEKHFLWPRLGESSPMFRGICARVFLTRNGRWRPSVGPTTMPHSNSTSLPGDDLMTTGATGMLHVPWERCSWTSHWWLTILPERLITRCSILDRKWLLTVSEFVNQGLYQSTLSDW